MARVQGWGATQNMPTGGSASYAGSLHTDLQKGTDVIGSLLGDLAMTVDFTKAGAPDGVSGEITNIRGKVGADDITYDGKLTTADAKARGLTSSFTVNTSTLPVVGETRTGGIMVNFTGELEVDGNKGIAEIMTGGIFTGDAAAGATGPAGGTFWGPGGPSDYVAKGTWFVERN